MKKISKRQKLIVTISVIIIVVILSTIFTVNIIKNNNLSEEYMGATGNAGSDLIASYIKKGITIGGITGTLEILDTSDATAKEEDIAWGKTAYVDGKKITGTRLKKIDGVTIPEGFYYVGGKIKTGIVISDNLEDEDKYKDLQEVPSDGLVGNQFVWIPVDNSSRENFNKVFQRQNNISYAGTEPALDYCGEANAEGINSKVTETNTTKEEAKEMYESVYKNGGFFVGRYEVGKDKDENVVIKKGTTDNPVKPYDDIMWSANGEMQETTGTTGGAVEISRNFDTANNYKTVTSTLIYAVQWDAIMNFIDPNYITNAAIGTPVCSVDSFVRDSTGKGNYNGSTTICGFSDDYRVNNIYDLAGNVWEWTMESSSTNVRVYRGGYWALSGASYPSSSRSGDVSSAHGLGVGFRVALYV